MSITATLQRVRIFYYAPGPRKSGHCPGIRIVACREPDGSFLSSADARCPGRRTASPQSDRNSSTSQILRRFWGDGGPDRGLALSAEGTSSAGLDDRSGSPQETGRFGSMNCLWLRSAHIVSSFCQAWPVCRPHQSRSRIECEIRARSANSDRLQSRGLAQCMKRSLG